VNAPPERKPPPRGASKVTGSAARINLEARSPVIVTLLSDFGGADTYAGQMKGAILAVAPEAVLVDLTHAVPAQDVRAGAFHLWAAVEAFPAGTVHLAVVDPGVGTTRRAIAARSKRGDLFVGPDNGLLMAAINRLGGLVAAVQLEEPRFFRDRVSFTFHGRDVFGPIAGYLARDGRLEELGPSLAEVDRSVDFARPEKEGPRVLGEVLHADVYGNLVTNIPASMLPSAFEVRAGNRVIRDAPHRSYQDVESGDPVALIGSNGLLELSVRDGSAKQLLRARVGTKLVVEPKEW
jgi:S-adenosyl-L-methionine hydrolase (adenosine-forming)